MVDSNHKNQDRIRQLFCASDAASPEPSPFLKTRVLARVRELKTQKRLASWKRWAILSPLATAALVFLIFMNRPAQFKASVHEDVLVRVEVQELKASNIAYAEIELPEDVVFYSKRYPELQELREIRVAWLDRYEEDALPIVVRANTPGVKRVKLRFLDQNENVLTERELTIQFKLPMQQGGLVAS